jgi:hypothetical protein
MSISIFDTFINITLYSHQHVIETYMSSTIHLLSQGDGYGIVLGFGAAFALGMIATTLCLQRYHNEATDSSEGFTTANRKVKTGLIASAVISSWTWAATLLQSSSVAYS